MTSTIDDYLVHYFLGKGSLSKVKAVSYPETDCLYAAKIIKPKSWQTENRMRKSLETELANLQKLDHPNLVRVISAVFSGIYRNRSLSKQSQCMYLLSELCPNGNLYDMVFETGSFSENSCKALFEQLVQGLETCHLSGILHRDLKPENLLFGIDFELKISDFGSSLDLENELQTHEGLFRTASSHFAPEVYLGISNIVEIDIFALGVVLFFMRIGRLPWETASRSDVWYSEFMKNRNEFWLVYERMNRGISKEFKELVEMCVEYKADKRISIEEIKNHEWYRGEVGSLQEELEQRRGRMVNEACRHAEEKAFVSNIKGQRRRETWSGAEVEEEKEVLRKYNSNSS